VIEDFGAGAGGPGGIYRHACLIVCQLTYHMSYNTLSRLPAVAATVKGMTKKY
jgi:hypothetical protein